MSIEYKNPFGKPRERKIIQRATGIDCLYPALPVDANDLVAQEISSWRADGWVKRMELIKKEKQLFAVRGLTAYDVTDEELSDETRAVTFRSVMIDGDAIIAGGCEERGGVRVLRWMWWHGDPQHWVLTWRNANWIHADELYATPAQIMENIADEVSRGETPLTGSEL